MKPTKKGFRAAMCAAILAIAAAAGGCGAERAINADARTDVPTDGLEIPDGPVDRNDNDHDCISDTHEGKHAAGGARDTDNDTVPDYKDTDSDNDTLPDNVEVGRPCERIDLPPRDTNGDGVPDFQSTDADGNGIPDAQEGTLDRDADGAGDFADMDNDGDNIMDAEEIRGDGTGTPARPHDEDSDGTPDYLDRDSDDDTVCDRWEGMVDSDGDTVPDRHDLDSDNDGLSDELEGGVTGECGEPVDTDRDGLADFRDPDADNDGLPDGYEWNTTTTDFRDPDTDDDGVTDLIEVAAGTDPKDPSDNPRVRGDFVFKIPYNEEPDPPQDTLVFSTNIQQADVYFLVDTTASMGGEIDNLTDTLSTTVIPSIRDEILDVWFGVGAFDDYPVSPYGSGARGDLPFYQVKRMTSSADEAQTAVATLVVHFGDDRAESHVTALYSVATGLGDGTYIDPASECLAGEVGYPCFRPRALPIIILITDAPFHNGPDGANPYTGIATSPVSYDDMLDALGAIHARVIGVNSGFGRAHLTRIATDTGTVDNDTNPLVFDIYSDGRGLGAQIVTAVSILANQVPIQVSTEPVDDASDAVDATLFINRIVPNTDGGIPAPDNPAIVCVGGLETANVDPDPYDDVFTRVLPGTAVCFDIYVNRNETVPATDEVQTFKATINVIGDGITVLDSRDVFFFIPPEMPIIFG